MNTLTGHVTAFGCFTRTSVSLPSPCWLSLLVLALTQLSLAL
jgi:hypothetical protein